MLFFLAGLQSLPASAREAAIMEGATSTQVFFKVTLPLLRPTLSFVITTAADLLHNPDRSCRGDDARRAG
ncbi:glycerol-3-phosphate transporter permease [Cedecea neteri]|uniref:Glycerol-3-phosphate transporter permease n=1 Tax=Cedecea neteri TaxID=158822 RepID=A0A2X3JFT0_9ENTR|nr:glycerol-3-phosphate transporter permease [Cedecea neteri]